VPPLLTIAHRAGNRLDDLRGALDAGVDLVEADVHLFRGALEVRHWNALGRHVVWRHDRLLRWRRDVELPVLADVLAGAGGDHRLMLDLKGPALAVAPRVAALLRELAPGGPLTICTKQWRMLDAFRGDPHVRLVYSASNRLQLDRLRSRVRRRPGFGVSIRRRLLTPAVTAELRATAGVVMVWPVDTQDELDHARWLGVTGVISKNLPLLRALLTE
jgi:glycerophosphoryl diester phosphodiesterase